MQISAPGIALGNPDSFSQLQVPHLQSEHHNAMHIAARRMEKHLRCLTWSQGWTNVTLPLGLWFLAEAQPLCPGKLP